MAKTGNGSIKICCEASPSIVMKTPASLTVILIMFMALFSSPGIARAVAPFKASSLVKPGDEVKFGSYLIRKIGDKAFQINDPGDKTTKGGGWGVDMYLVCGTKKALLIDLGNNYITGYEKDLVKLRKDAAEDLRTVISGLTGKLQLEVAVTHMHPDHDGDVSSTLTKPVLMLVTLTGGLFRMWQPVQMVYSRENSLLMAAEFVTLETWPIPTPGQIQREGLS